MRIIQTTPARIANLRATGPNASFEVGHEPRTIARALAPECLPVKQGVHRAVDLGVHDHVPEVPTTRGAVVSAVGQHVHTLRRFPARHLRARYRRAITLMGGHVE